jgi:hypothetical protein
MPLAGKVLTPLEVARYAFKAGIPLKNIAVCVAVCWQESKFYCGAYNFIGADRSYGLWQINMKDGMGPERRAKYGLARNEDLYKPEHNARIMADMSLKGTKWTPWGAYTSGAYEVALPDGNKAAAALAAELKVAAPPKVKAKPTASPVAQVSWISHKRLCEAFRSSKGVSAHGSLHDVGQMQRALKATVGLVSGDGTGVYGTRTKTAMKKYQKRCLVSQTGWPTEGTIRKLADDSGMFRVRDFER